MRRVFLSIAGGTFVMTLAAICSLFGGRRLFIWVMAWPVLILHPFFPPAAPDQIFPILGSLAGIFSTLVFATLSYSLLIYLVLWLRAKPMRLR
jgi:hypothetical protein